MDCVLEVFGRIAGCIEIEMLTSAVFAFQPFQIGPPEEGDSLNEDKNAEQYDKYLEKEVRILTPKKTYLFRLQATPAIRFGSPSERPRTS